MGDVRRLLLNRPLKLLGTARNRSCGVYSCLETKEEESETKETEEGQERRGTALEEVMTSVCAYHRDLLSRMLQEVKSFLPEDEHAATAVHRDACLTVGSLKSEHSAPCCRADKSLCMLSSCVATECLCPCTLGVCAVRSVCLCMKCRSVTPGCSSRSLLVCQRTGSGDTTHVAHTGSGTHLRCQSPSPPPLSPPQLSPEPQDTGSGCEADMPTLNTHSTNTQPPPLLPHNTHTDQTLTPEVHTKPEHFIDLVDKFTDTLMEASERDWSVHAHTGDRVKACDDTHLTEIITTVLHSSSEKDYNLKELFEQHLAAEKRSPQTRSQRRQEVMQAISRSRDQAASRRQSLQIKRDLARLEPDISRKKKRKTHLITHGTHNNQVPGTFISHTQNSDTPISHTQNSDTPILHTQNPDTPILHTQNPDTPILHTQNPDMPILHTQNPDTPILHTQNPDTPILHTQNPDTPILHTQNPDTPILHTQNPDTPILHTQSLDTPILHTQDPDAPILHIQSPNTPNLHMQSLDTPILHTQNPDMPILHTQNTDTPILHSQSLDTPMLHTQDPDVPILHIQSPDTPISHTQSPDRPVLHSQSPETPILHTQSLDTPISHTQNPDTPISHTQNPDTPILHSQSSDTPIIHTLNPDTPISHTQSPDRTILHSQSPDMPISHTQNSDTPILYTQNPDTPILHSQRPDTPISYTQNPDTPILHSQRPDTPISYTQNPDTPILHSQRPDTPVSHTQNPDTPILHSQRPDTPVSHTQNPDTPISYTQNPDTPILHSQRPDTPVSHTQNPDTLISHTQNPDSSISRTQNTDKTILCIQKKDTPILHTQNPDTPMLHSQSLDTPILHTQDPGAPILHIQSPNTPILHIQSLDTPISHTQSPDRPVLHSQSPETPIVNTQNPDTPILHTQTPDTPTLHTLNPDMPISHTQNPDMPILHTQTTDTPTLHTLNPDTPISYTQNPDTPILHSQRPDTPVSHTQNPDTFISRTQKMDMTILYIQNQDTPILHTQSPDTPISYTQKPNMHISHTQNPDTPILFTQSLDTPILHTQNQDTPISHTQNPDLPILHTQSPDKPISYTQNPDTPILHTQSPDTPMSHTQSPDPPISHALNQDTSDLHARSPDTTISDTPSSDTPTSTAQSPDTPVSNTQDTPILNLSISHVQSPDMPISDLQSPYTPSAHVQSSDKLIPQTQTPDTPISHLQSLNTPILQGQSPDTTTLHAQTLDTPNSYTHSPDMPSLNTQTSNSPSSWNQSPESEACGNVRSRRHIVRPQHLSSYVTEPRKMFYTACRSAKNNSTPTHGTDMIEPSPNAAIEQLKTPPVSPSKRKLCKDKNTAQLLLTENQLGVKTLLSEEVTRSPSPVVTDSIDTDDTKYTSPIKLMLVSTVKGEDGIRYTLKAAQSHSDEESFDPCVEASWARKTIKQQAKDETVKTLGNKCTEKLSTDKTTKTEGLGDCVNSINEAEPTLKRRPGRPKKLKPPPEKAVKRPIGRPRKSKPLDTKSVPSEDPEKQKAEDSSSGEDGNKNLKITITYGRRKTRRMVSEGQVPTEQSTGSGASTQSSAAEETTQSTQVHVSLSKEQFGLVAPVEDRKHLKHSIMCPKQSDEAGVRRPGRPAKVKISGISVTVTTVSPRRRKIHLKRNVKEPAIRRRALLTLPRPNEKQETITEETSVRHSVRERRPSIHLLQCVAMSRSNTPTPRARKLLPHKAEKTVQETQQLEPKDTQDNTTRPKTFPQDATRFSAASGESLFDANLQWWPTSASPETLNEEMNRRLKVMKETWVSDMSKEEATSDEDRSTAPSSSAVRILFERDCSMETLCSWFMQTTETQSLAIVKKANNRNPCELFQYSSSQASIRPNVCWSPQAERLRKSIKKFATVVPKSPMKLRQAQVKFCNRQNCFTKQQVFTTTNNGEKSQQCGAWRLYRAALDRARSRFKSRTKITEVDCKSLNKQEESKVQPVSVSEHGLVHTLKNESRRTSTQQKRIAANAWSAHTLRECKVFLRKLNSANTCPMSEESNDCTVRFSISPAGGGSVPQREQGVKKSIKLEKTSSSGDSTRQQSKVNRKRRQSCTNVSPLSPKRQRSSRGVMAAKWSDFVLGPAR